MFNKLNTPLAKIGLTVFTIILYTTILGWKIALLFIAATVIHECGHLVAAKIMKLKTSGGISFIVGRYKRLSQNSFVSLAGPIIGSLLALFLYVAYLSTGIPFLLGAIFWVCLLNVSNLLPMSSLDGGQIIGTVAHSVNGKLGFYFRIISSAIFVLVIAYFNIVIAIIIGAIEFKFFYSRLSLRVVEGEMHWTLLDNLPTAKKMNTKQIWLTLATWAGTVIILGSICLLMKDNHESSVRFLFENK